MDLSIYAKDFTQHDLFGLFPGAPGGRALRDSYGHDCLVKIAQLVARPYSTALAGRVVSAVMLGAAPLMRRYHLPTRVFAFG